jgi:hypothetical protein
MATYVNDLRLKEIATGDESGTWGTSTNTNLELIADAFSYATKDCFASDADATETMADGVADEIRSLYLKVTSSATLTATRTLTLAPNTVSKTWIIENATTGSQSINISQGSGANVTIPNGDTKIIYTDGAGAGATVTDAFANLKVTDPAQTNITSVGALNGGSITSGFGSIDVGSSAITTTGTVTGNTLAGTLSTAAQPNITSVGTLTGLDVAGTPTFDGLTVDSDTINFNKTTSGLGGIYFNDASSNGSAVLSNGSDAQALRLWLDRTSASNFGYLEVVDGSSAKNLLLVDDSGDISFYDDTGSTQALFWDASTERLGIGTTSPNYLLDVDTIGHNSTGEVLITAGNASSNDYTQSTLLRLRATSINPNSLAHNINGAVSEIRLNHTDQAGNASGGTMTFHTNNGNNIPGALAERMRIEKYGTVCINCTGPAISTSTALAVLGSGTQESVAIECRKTSATTSSSQRFIRFFANNGSTSMGGIVGNGASNVQFAAISDERLKENIQPLSGSLDKVLALNPISYNWKDSGEHIEAGFVAQEVEQVLPEYVTTEEDADQTKGLTGGMTAGYISVLTKAIQEQQTIIESLEARITALES